MKRNGTLFALLMLVSLYALGCGEDVGSCDDPNEGRDTVLVDSTTVQYGGQAIINKSCASCHGSGATGDGRRGAPAGLDFDLVPADPDDPDQADGTQMNEAGETVVRLKPAVLAGLRARQRKVFEERNLIWQQVKDGLMPPDGLGAAFKRLASIFSSPEESPCTKGNAYPDITTKAAQDVLRNWLACGAPIVETNATQVTKNRSAGAAGYQYPSCSAAAGDAGPGGDGGVVITLEQVQEQIFDGACSGCHPSVDPVVDLTSADNSFEAFVMDTAVKCDANNKPYITKGRPDQSFLYELVSTDDPACSLRMPADGTKLSTAQIKLISDWITGGALRESDVDKSRNPLQGGLDAGVP